MKCKRLMQSRYHIIAKSGHEIQILERAIKPIHRCKFAVAIAVVAATAIAVVAATAIAATAAIAAAAAYGTFQDCNAERTFPSVVQSGSSQDCCCC